MKWILIILIICIVVIFGGYQAYFLHKAHSTFENYYAFRGCTELLERGDDYGICRTGSGDTIKIVKYNDKWYLDGDLPWGCILGICLGW